MNPLASFTFLIRVGRDLAAAVLTRDRLETRPVWGKKAVARRLASGLRVLGAYLRRLLVLMALALEPDLRVKDLPLRRPHGRKMQPGVHFMVLKPDLPLPEDFARRSGPPLDVASPGHARRMAQGGVGLARLYRQLDLMAAILADPLPRARRLALHLARCRPGILLAPQGPARIAGRWGTEVPASFEAMAVSIITQSRNRPPPLPPPRRHWRSVTVV
ncbi:MAG: hypothetical protein MUF14_07975 [Hyphomonadaceae bacterium]|nr:hypothetical protein [Hyphomonadaceae bacterium]